MDREVQARVRALPWWRKLRRQQRRTLELRIRTEIWRDIEQREEAVAPEKQVTVSAGSDPRLTRVIQANGRRRAALAADDAELARAALGEIVTDLDGLLDDVAVRLRESGESQELDRAKVAQLVKGDLAASTAAALPLEALADLFDMSDDQVERALRGNGMVTPETLDEALAQLDYLRAQLRVVAENDDHELLDRLLGFIPHW